jgi:pSer/pThr/pTyr-binding forkhead associated (FHA) protein
VPDDPADAARADRQPPRSTDPSTMRFTGLGDLDTHPETDGSLSSEDHATIEALRPGTALLLVLRGPNTGARFLLDQPLTTTGRHPDSDIFLDDVTVSRKHAVFKIEGDTFSVRDVGSLNGTYVNKSRIDSAVLRPNDEVQIGKYRLVFHSAQSAQSSQSTG